MRFIVPKHLVRDALTCRPVATSEIVPGDVVSWELLGWPIRGVWLRVQSVEPSDEDPAEEANGWARIYDEADVTAMRAAGFVKVSGVLTNGVPFAASYSALQMAERLDDPSLLDY
jgi:hypothetical protein